MKLIWDNYFYQNMHKDQITSNLTPRSAYTWIFTPYDWLMRLVPLPVNIFLAPGWVWSWESKDQSLKVSAYRNNFQIINDIWTLEPPLLLFLS